MSSDYSEAVQTPHLAFTDSELRTGQPEVDNLGLPKPRSGNFAVVYKILVQQRSWAVKCFTSETREQQERYDAISRHLATARLPYTIPFTYSSNAIIVQGRAYPILKMEWVQGEPLGVFVVNNLRNPAALRALADKWVKMVAALQSAHISHGDLQDRNVLVVGGELRLIDYDGMFVPALRGRSSTELGQQNFQHPARTEYDFGPQLDNFSAWVIRFSLLALSVHPELWAKHRGGDECLLLRKEDFLDPSNSEVLRDLNRSSNSQIRALTQLFISLQNFSPLDVPALDGSQTSIAVAPLSQPSVSSWWEDHVGSVRKVEEAPTEPNTDREPVIVAPDLSWILDSTESRETVERLRFKNSLTIPRVVLAGSLALTFLLAFLAQMPAFVTVVATVGVLGLNLLICFSRYKSDPSVAEKFAFKRGVDEFLQRIRQQQTIIDSISAERSQIQEWLTDTQAEITAQAAKLHIHRQTEMTQAQAKLARELQAVDQQRRERVGEEARELQAVQRTLGDQIAALDRKIAALIQSESIEKDNALKVLQKAFIENYLRGFRIGDAWIHGVGASLVNKMSMQGIVTAADAEKLKYRRVSGIGYVKGHAIECWRAGLEADARRKAPSSLSRLEIANIENKYFRERQTLSADKQRMQSQLDSQVAAIRQKSTTTRQSLAQDEQRIRNASDRESQSVGQLHDAEHTALQQKLTAAKGQAAPTISELTDKLRTAQKQTFALHWQSAKHDREMQRFNALDFGNYVKSVAGL